MKKRFLPLIAAALGSTARGGDAPGTPVADCAVLVHGIFEDGSKFKKMRARLESRGIRCLTPKLRHMDGYGGLDLLAEHLKEDIDEAFGPKRRIIVIGFSMGGLVTRHYLQNLGGAERCETFITISSPHHGTAAAWAFPSKGVIQMRPGSDFLASLEATQGNLGDMPVISYRTPMDLIILPAKSSIWDRAENVEFPVIAHPLMIQSDKVLSDIERRLVR